MTYDCFCATTAKLSSCSRKHVEGKAQSRYYWTFSEKITNVWSTWYVANAP